MCLFSSHHSIPSPPAVPNYRANDLISFHPNIQASKILYREAEGTGGGEGVKGGNKQRAVGKGFIWREKVMLFGKNYGNAHT